MSLWAFRFLLWYICVLFVQPQNRFPFLYPWHLADLCVIASLALHGASCLREKRPLLRLGPGTVVALLLLAAGFTAQYAGVYQTDTSWNGYIDQLAKGALLLIMVEAMATSVERLWAVLATMMIASLWWIKGGLRLIQAGATFSLDRLMGPAVSIVHDPNGFALMMSAMIPLYLYFFQQSERRWLRWAFLAAAVAAAYIAMETGSRTGFLILLAVGLFVFLKYSGEHKMALLVSGVAIFLVFSAVSPKNVERFRTIPQSVRAFFGREKEKPVEEMTQDELSAYERRMKNRHTWALIKEHPVFGVGMNPDEREFLSRFPMAGGQVHNELLMAGREMGIVGMALWVSLYAVMGLGGYQAQRRTQGWWPGVADIGWTLKVLAAALVIGGLFSPLPWNPVAMILAGAASALRRCVRAYEGTAPAVKRLPLPAEAVAATP